MPGELTALWEAHGLGSVASRPLTISMRYASFDDYWQPFLPGQGPAGADTVSLSEVARAALRQRLRQRLEANGPFTLRAGLGGPGRYRFPPAKALLRRCVRLGRW